VLNVTSPLKLQGLVMIGVDDGVGVIVGVGVGV